MVFGLRQVEIDVYQEQRTGAGDVGSFEQLQAGSVGVESLLQYHSFLIR